MAYVSSSSSSVSSYSGKRCRRSLCPSVQSSHPGAGRNRFTALGVGFFFFCLVAPSSSLSVSEVRLTLTPNELPKPFNAPRFTEDTHPLLFVEVLGVLIDLWMVHNRLKLNQDKTEVLVFSSCYRPRPNIGNLAIVDMMVNCSTKAKDIGVTLDNSLSMVPHITAVCKSAFFHLRNISKIRGFLNTETTKTLVHAFVTSKVDYCNSLLYGVPKYLLQRLQRVLNCAARIVFKSNKYDHITPLLRELHWLPIQQRIEFKILLITFKALNKQAPTYLTDLLISYTPSRSLRSSSKNLLKIPMYNLKSYGGRSFALASAVLWNSLPQSLRDLQSVETFKRKLKKHLFLQAYMEH